MYDKRNERERDREKIKRGKAAKAKLKGECWEKCEEERTKRRV